MQQSNNLSDLDAVMISGFRFPYRQWRPGLPRLGPVVAIDTETSLIVDHEIPDLALAAASDGRVHVLIHPDHLPAFMTIHDGVEFVCHNAAFDFWVIWRHFHRRGDQAALKLWVDVVRERRLHDTMLLDILIRLAGGAEDFRDGNDDSIIPRNLEEVVRDCTGLEITKSDPYRLRYGEIIGQDWSLVEPGFFEYAIKDPIATISAYHEQRLQAGDILIENGWNPAARERFGIYPDAPERFGLLSEAIQVEGAIALEAIRRNGLHIDRQKLQASERDYRDTLSPIITEFRTKYPGILLLDAQGQSLLTPTGSPRRSNTKLDKQLRRVIDDLNRDSAVKVAAPRTPTHALSRSVDKWEPYLDRHPFLQTWRTFEKTTKRLQFFQSLNQPVIHPRYQVLVRTGRTSCSKPNLQQVPREDAFRQMIVPSPGHLLLTVDYSFIELVTLAAVCQSRFGYSKLGNVIRDGVDPHCYTAAMLLDVPLEIFMGWKTSQTEIFKESRQRAKPVNFGVPGGMGAAALVEYARSTYGVEMTPEQSQAFHDKLTRSIYPELGEYLADHSLADLARQLQVPETICRDAIVFGDGLPSMAIGAVRKILAGKAAKQDGTPYNADFVLRTWQTLRSLNRNPELADAFRAGIGSSGLAARIFKSSAVTLTGRVRGNVTYTQERNTPFQSLASDGAKRALNRLILGGYRVVGFVHDEVLVELPDQGGFVSQTIVDDVVRIIRDAMQEMTGTVPVGCEYALSTCWSKKAELIVRDGRVWAWTPDK